MPRKSAPTRSPRPRPRPGTEPPGLRGYGGPGVGSNNADEERQMGGRGRGKVAKMKTGGMCRGMGAATRGGGYKS
jgi:hypothetical protein